ncbi:MAG TPA: hypothetical protein VH249_16750 [Xanthobacteraceae bacterium]|nr:hypothetical protein [Xanthobacteraceae bacterium]
MVEPRRLLAAVSLLGASLGVSAAAPADPISGSEPGLQSADAAARLAETKTPHSPGSDSSYTWGLNSPSDRLASNQKKGSRNTKSMGWDVRSSQSNQYKSNQNKNEIHIKSNQNKGTLPAAR